MREGRGAGCRSPLARGTCRQTRPTGANQFSTSQSAYPRNMSPDCHRAIQRAHGESQSAYPRNMSPDCPIPLGREPSSHNPRTRGTCRQTIVIVAALSGASQSAYPRNMSPDYALCSADSYRESQSAYPRNMSPDRQFSPPRSRRCHNPRTRGTCRQTMVSTGRFQSVRTCHNPRTRGTCRQTQPKSSWLSARSQSAYPRNMSPDPGGLRCSDG